MRHLRPPRGLSVLVFTSLVESRCHGGRDDHPLVIDTNVKEWIRYITSLSGMMIDIEQDAIWLKPLSYGESLLLKRVYIVPEAVFSTKAQAEELLKPIVPQFISLIFSGILTRDHICGSNSEIPSLKNLKKKYAKELLQHGFRLPSPASKWKWCAVQVSNLRPLPCQG